MTGHKLVMSQFPTVLICHIIMHNSATQAHAVADTGAGYNGMKYVNLATTRMFVPIAVEIGGSWTVEAVEFVQDVGKRVSDVINEPLGKRYLFQFFSMAAPRVSMQYR